MIRLREVEEEEEEEEQEHFENRANDFHSD